MLLVTMSSVRFNAICHLLSPDKVKKPVTKIKWIASLFTREITTVQLKMSTKFISTLKLLHCNSIAVFYSMKFINLSKNFIRLMKISKFVIWIIINFQKLWKKILHSVCEKLFVGNHGERRCRNFAKEEFWKVHVFFVVVFLIFVSNFILGVNVRVAWQIYVFKVKSCLGVA